MFTSQCLRAWLNTNRPASLRAGTQVGLASLLALAAGCAQDLAFKQAQGVAKGWCQTIRASQVMPTYPLTEDLVVGDVFLVQRPISTQTKQYNKNGFLPLDHHFCRLRCTDYSAMYFNGYWSNTFGMVPHAQATYADSCSLSNGQFVAMTSAEAPRTAFPTYSFGASSSLGLSAALPIQGVPVALGFLGSGRVGGSVTISDSRTYGADQWGVFKELRKYVGDPEVKEELANVARLSWPDPVFLRVVNRVHLARGLEVSLQSTNNINTQASAGALSPVLTNGGFNTNYANLLTTLTAKATTAANIGGSVQFTSAGEHSVGLAQTFDHLLAFGYVGFDVQVFENGTLGTPIPTFEHISGGAAAWKKADLEFLKNRQLLQSVAQDCPDSAVRIMRSVATNLDCNYFIPQPKDPCGTGASCKYEAIQASLRQFNRNAASYVASSALVRPWTWFSRDPERVWVFNAAFSEAFHEEFKKDNSTQKVAAKSPSGT